MSVNWNPSGRAALHELQDNLISELERLGTPVAAIHYVMTDLLAHELRVGQIAQRVRRVRERRERHARQLLQKPELRERCVKVYEARCAYCEKAGTPEAGPDGESWTLDRILPGAYGGEYDPLNVALACHVCNTKKGAAVTFCPPPSLAELEDCAALGIAAAKPLRQRRLAQPKARARPEGERPTCSLTVMEAR